MPFPGGSSGAKCREVLHSQRTFDAPFETSEAQHPTIRIEPRGSPNVILDAVIFTTVAGVLSAIDTAEASVDPRIMIDDVMFGPRRRKPEWQCLKILQALIIIPLIEGRDRCPIRLGLTPS